MARAPRISFIVTVEELKLIQGYCEQKKRWRNAAALARDALWQHISRNPLSDAQVRNLAETHQGDPKTAYAVLRRAPGGKE